MPSRLVQRDPRVRDHLLPRAIVWQSDAPAPERAATLLAPSDTQTGQPGARCVLAHGSGVLLDFGRELNGGVQLVVDATSDNKPVRVRVRFGESASEAMADPFPIHGHAIHDQRVLVSWMGHTEIGTTGFRFARIDVDDPGKRIELVAIRAVHLYRDLPWRGEFRCDDARLDEIWRVGAYTTQLCLQDLVWDGVKRDRLVWIGDMHPETMTTLTAFGAVEPVTASLDFLRDHTPLPGWMNGISSYSLWWLLIQRTWWLYAGDAAYLGAQHAYLSGLCDQILAKVDGDGRERIDGWRFLDWPSSRDPQAIDAGLHGLVALGLDAGAQLGDALGDHALATRCRTGVARLRTRAIDAGPSKQANALLALAGVRDAATVNREVLARDPLSGLSTFYGYYVLQARAAAGDHPGCLDVIRRFWGGMLDLGATTFWEDFDLAWAENSFGIDSLPVPGKRDIHADFGAHCYQGLRHSLCHGWASGPTAWLSEHVLGVTPLAPGFAKARVAPRLGGLAWAEGAVPTPHGEVRVRHVARADGGVDSEISAPAGIELVRA